MAEQNRAPRVRPRTPQQLKRQEEVFLANVIEGKTVRQLAAQFKISQETVISDIRHEEKRRADENAARRDTDKARSTSFYEHVAAEALRLAAQADGIEVIGTESEDPNDRPPKLVSKQGLVRALDSAIKARERIDKLLGLDAPTKIDVAVQGLVEALTTIDPDAPLFPSDPEAAAPAPTE